MLESEILTGTLLEEAALTLDELMRACAVDRQWVVHRVDEGLLPAVRLAAGEWRFGSRELARARRLSALERDFDAVPELAALVADLMEEMESLRARLARAGL